MKTDLSRLLTKSMNRRQMLGNLGMMGAGAALTACSSVIAQPGEDTDTGRDVDAAILAFALNLEYLEAAFYLAAAGRITDLPGYQASKIGLPQGFDGNSAMDFGAGAQGSALAAFADEIAKEELAHVVFLRSALGDAGVNVELPALNLDSSFRTAASAAGLAFANDFNPYANGAFFAHGAYIFEDVGVTAYKGAAPLIKNSDYLSAAAGILAAEAYHAGNIRTFLYLADDNVLDFYGGLDTHGVTQAISDARDSLDGSADLDQGIANVNDVATGGQANITPLDDNGIAFSRTPAQVAAIAYLSANVEVSDASFFPEGINTAGLDEDFNFLLSL